MTKVPQKKKTTCKRSVCPIANTLDIVGDKWSLLIVRDLLFFGKKRYTDFASSPESIPTNILADRLKFLEKEGIVSRKAYQSHPPRYEYGLTTKGKDLKGMLLEILRWSHRHLPHAMKVTKESLPKS